MIVESSISTKAPGQATFFFGDFVSLLKRYTGREWKPIGNQPWTTFFLLGIENINLYWKLSCLCKKSLSELRPLEVYSVSELPLCILHIVFLRYLKWFLSYASINILLIRTHYAFDQLMNVNSKFLQLINIFFRSLDRHSFLARAL